MNGLDIVISACVAICALYGLWKGFVRIAVGIAGLGISLAFALRLMGFGPEWFGQVFASDQLSRIVAFLLVFALGLLATAAMAWVAHKLVKSAQISWLDRLIGGGVGAVGGALVICGVLVGVTAVLPPGAKVLETSLLIPYVIVVSDAAAVILPPEMAALYRERRQALEKRLTLPESGFVEHRSHGTGDRVVL